MRAALRLLQPTPHPAPPAVPTHAPPAAPPPAPTVPPPPPLPDEPTGTWLTPEEAGVKHSQVRIVRTRSNSVLWAQIDGYDIERRRKHWRAISLATRRPVQVKRVLAGSCPRLGGRRERARR